MTLAELFAPIVHAHAHDTALEFGADRLTFGDLDRRSNQVARWLMAKGFAAGDRLGIYLANRVEYIDLFQACAKTGIIAVPINILYREREVSHIARDAEPKAIFAAGPVPGVSSDTCLPVEALREAGELSDESIDAGTLVADSPLAIIYTSGTTGTAKGAVLSHANFISNTSNLIKVWRITRDDRLLLPLPLFHVHGLGNGVCCWLASGCRMRLLERFDYATAAEEFLAFRPTLLFAVPTIYIRLLDWPADVARNIGAGMRLFVSGSAALPAHVHQAFAAAFGHSILERYGMTETLMIASNPYHGERRAGTVGFPLPGVDLRIVDSEGRDVTADEAGEVWVKGANVFAEYWHSDDATRAAFVGGWFKTGDIGVRSPDDYVSLRGRATDLIISGGFNIYPREIEEVILETPGVREAVVVGAADPVRGEVPIAYLATDDSYDEAVLIDTLNRTLASFKMPRRFIKLDKIPRTALGKVQRHLLPSA